MSVYLSVCLSFCHEGSSCEVLPNTGLTSVIIIITIIANHLRRDIGIPSLFMPRMKLIIGLQMMIIIITMTLTTVTVM